jgi:hypothetical protein
MKDFYDIWLLCRQFDFEGERLAEAIRLTLERRGTLLTDVIVPLSKEFASAKQVQWAAFCKRLQQEYLPIEFGLVVSAVKAFLTPIASALATGRVPPVQWKAPGGWT